MMHILEPQKALNDLLLTRDQTDEEIDQALTVVPQLYEQHLITSLQRHETRNAISSK
jgi:hypothetical protein